MFWKYLGKKKSLKNLYYKWTSSQVIFKVSSRIFFFFFFSPITFPPIYRSLCVPYITHIICICIHICKRYYFLLLLFLRWNAKEKLVLVFGWHLLPLSVVLNVKPFFCLNVFAQENCIISDFKPMFLSYRNNLFDLHDGKAGCKCFS